MRIDLVVDDSQLRLWSAMAQKKIAYGAVKAINDTAKDLQALERAHLQEVFTVRKPEFMQRQVAIIKPFASVNQGRPYAEISVGQKPRLLLSEYERGGDRTPFVGKHVAIPVRGGPARPTWETSVPAEMTFRALSIRKVRQGQLQYTKTGRIARETKRGLAFKKHVTRYGQIQWQGAHRTFILSHFQANEFGGVFQRVGPKRSDIVLVYYFRAPFYLRARLRFVATAEANAPRLLREHLETQLVEAMGHARRAG